VVPGRARLREVEEAEGRETAFGVSEDGGLSERAALAIICKGDSGDAGGDASGDEVAERLGVRLTGGGGGEGRWNDSEVVN